MDAEAVVSVSAAVVALTQLAKWGGLRDGHGVLAVVSFSLIGVVVWGYAEGTYERARAFQYFASWIAVATSAAGVYGFTRGTAAAVTTFKQEP